MTANSIYTAHNKTCVDTFNYSLNSKKKIYCVYLHNFFNLYTYTIYNGGRVIHFVFKFVYKLKILQETM